MNVYGAIKAHFNERTIIIYAYLKILYVASKVILGLCQKNAMFPQTTPC